MRGNLTSSSAGSQIEKKTYRRLQFGTYPVYYRVTTVFSFFQVLLSSALVGAEYEDVTVDPGRAILPDTTVAPGGDFLYVLSTAKVGIFL
jgi:hypothetical protein